MLHNNGFRHNIGHPSDVTIEFLRPLLSMKKDYDKRENQKSLLPIIRSFYLNKDDRSDDDIIPLIQTFKEICYLMLLKILKKIK